MLCTWYDVCAPAAYGTSMVMLLVGYCCASALVQNAIDAISDVTNEIRFIVGSGGEGAILRKGKLARPAGFEPTTLGFGGQYSDPLSYGRCGEDAQDSTAASHVKSCPYPIRGRPTP